MSYEELDRVSVIERVLEKRLTQREAARMLGLTARQVRRLRRAYVRDGPRSLASKHFAISVSPFIERRSCDSEVSACLVDVSDSLCVFEIADS